MPRDAQLPSDRIISETIELIRSGTLRPGEQLPTVSALCQTYSVSKVTALKAMTVLRDLGWITTIPRWGSFVAESPGREPGQQSAG